MRNLLLSLLVVFPVLISTAQNDNYFFERISPESGFAFDAIYTITEDCTGMVWFGCNNGLYLYNTREVKKILLYPNESSTPQALKVNKIVNDDQCRLWICTEVGLYTLPPKENEFVQIPLDLKELNVSTQSVEDILQIDEDNFLLSISNTLFEFNISSGSFREVKNNSFPIKNIISYLGWGKDEEILIGTTTGQVLKAKKDRIQEYTWFFGDSNVSVKSICIFGSDYLIGYDGTGLKIVDAYGDLAHTYNEERKDSYYLPSNRVRQIIKTSNGQIWVGTYRGILIISPGKRQIITDDGINGLPNNSIYVLHQGNNDGIWVGTWAGGVAYYSNYNYRFLHTRGNGRMKSGDHSVSSTIAEDASKYILIGSEYEGLSVYNPFNNTFDLENAEKLSAGLSRIKTINTDDGVNIYIGTFDSGLWHLNKNRSTINRIDLGFPASETIISSTSRVDQDIWVATRGYHGLFRYNTASSEVDIIDLAEMFPQFPLANWIWKVHTDSKNNLLVCSDNGLYKRTYATGEFHALLKDDTIFGLGKNIIYTIFEDMNGLFWLGTKGKGLFSFDVNSSRLEPFIYNDTIANSDIYGIVSDNDHNLWFSTNIGIYSYNTTTKALYHFSSADGLSGNQFIPNSVLKSSDGKLYFGASNGVNIIDPGLIRTNPIPPKVFLTRFLVNNQPYRLSTCEQASNFFIPWMEELRLKHNNNTLTFGFSSNNFIKPSQNKIRYRLKNYMNDWTIIENDNDIAFTKIRPGSYVLEVFGSNSDGVWNDEPYILPIKILPPVWFSWYAYLLYFLIVATVVYLIVRELRLRTSIRKDYLSERFKNDANQTIHDEKIKFFTNISHEFRTPLTLILSPINNLITKFQYDVPTAKQLKVIKRNAERLSRLTNQILDFRLLETGQIQAKPIKVDLLEICNNIIDYFEFRITEKKINFIFSSNYKSIWIAIDPDMIEKIIYNILSNSFKFSKEKDQILFSIEKKELNEEDYQNMIYTGNKFTGETLEIKVRDFGAGISPDVLPTIFDRFTKAPENTKTGSGIGLHMCQEYARLNNCNIMVTSEFQKGSIFTINIPYIKCSWSKKEAFVTQPHFDKIEHTESVKTQEYLIADNNTVILIVEDNDDLRIYLKNFLSKHFKVLTAKNGTQGLEIAFEIVPDIIITDIMMPGMDGIELTETIKSNPKTHFIPIIILTALSEERYQMQGLQKGADSYLIKPIDETILMAQIQNILKTRQTLKKMFDEKMESSKSMTPSSQLSFIDQAEQIILENLQKTEFNISELATLLNTSHSSLHRKIKSSVNQSPTEFIRDIRLKSAIKLMKDNKYNIDEISNYVGFNSTSYFMRSFKKKYGKTPKEYRRQMQTTSRDMVG